MARFSAHFAGSAHTDLAGRYEVFVENSADMDVGVLQGVMEHGESEHVEFENEVDYGCIHSGRQRQG